MRYRTYKTDIKLSTGQKIQEKFWDGRRGYIRRNMLASPDEQQALEQTDARLSGIESSIRKLANSRVNDLEKKDLKRIVQAYRNTPATAAGMDIMQNRDIPTDIIGYYDWLVGEMTSGHYLFKGRHYEASSLENWIYFRKILNKFLIQETVRTGQTPTFSDFDRRKADSFMHFLQDNGYLAKSVNKYITLLKALFKYAFKDGVHGNVRATQFLYKQRETKESASAKIYLTETELQALYEMPLEGIQEKVRDLFLVGCYTCQRISDYSRLTRENFSTTPRGTTVVRLTQEKTDNSIVIPVLNGNLLLIAEKYSYDIPYVNDDTLNKQIKNIARKLSETVPSLAELVPTTLTKTERNRERKRKSEGLPNPFRYNRQGIPVKPRYELISSHTARRSGITNLYLSGLFTVHQMMSVSGHSSEKNFYLYVRLSGDDIADQIDDILQKQARNRKKSNEDLF